MAGEAFSRCCDAFVRAGNSIEGPAPTVKGTCMIMATGDAGSALVFGDRVIIRNLKIRFTGPGRIVIASGASVAGEFIVDGGSEIRVGEDTLFRKPCRLHAAEGKSIAVGARCLFSNVRFRTSDMHSVVDLATGERINPAASITVGNGVWIAEDVNVYKGVTIGEGSIVGARSTVVRSIPQRSLAVGSPAKVVRENVGWKKELI